MSIRGQLGKLESAAYRRPRPKPAPPRTCRECDVLLPQLEVVLLPYEYDERLCGRCRLDRFKRINAIAEEADAGPSAAAASYAAEVGLPVREALDRLVKERAAGRGFKE